MFCGADLALEHDLADVEPVAQKIGERASGEGDAADGPSIREMADLGDDAALPGIFGGTGRLLATETVLSRVSGGKAAESQRLESLINRFVEQSSQVFMLRSFHFDTSC
jgi:hypothetical protein